MSQRQWTPAQRAAIEDTGGTLLISAAAGSGKTAVLVERALRLITDEAHPVDADALLIVTFTRAAAEEMRARLSARLAQEAAAHPDSRRLRRQRILLGRASICTIDSFCAELLKRYFAELELPPDFGVADEAQVCALRRDTLAAVLEESYADADFCRFASLYGRARSDSAAARAVEALYDFLRAMPHPDAALERMCESYESAAPLEQTLAGKVLLERAQGTLQNLCEVLRSAHAAVARDSALLPYETVLSAELAMFTGLQAYGKAGRWDDALRCLEQCVFGRLPAVRGDSPEKALVKELREKAKQMAEELRKDLFVCTRKEDAEDRAEAAPLLRALARAVRLFEKRFFAAKLEQKTLEYSDFEHLALQLLCEKNDQKTPIARAVSARFAAVMVDEYQDTNALQALLYQCLAKEDGSNLFFVGDVKQSIYRFRQASPDAFLAKRAAFAAYAAQGPRPATVVLGHNFRSAGNVIAQVNDVFGALMSRQAGGVDYTAQERLVQGTSSAFDGGPMLLRIGAAPEGALTDACAQLTAAVLAEQLKNGALVRGEDGAARVCRPEDFCILLRSRAGFQAFAAALRERGIPTFADTGENWITSPEVSCVLSLLRVVDNPGQDVPLAAAMLSPMFRFTPDDLIRLRMGNGKKRRLYASLLASELPEAKRFCETLAALRRMAGMLPPEKLCGELLRRTHLFAAVGAMENGPARRENLRSLLAFAAGVSAGSTGGLAALLRRVDDALEAGGVRGADAPLIPPGNVAIMTIHRSKGLEFPVCVLGDTQRAFNLTDANGSLLLHPALGVGFRLRAQGNGLYSTAPHAAVRFAIREESVSEEMRILYVALTRAKDRLIVTCTMREPEKTLENLAMTLTGAGGAAPWAVAEQRSFAAWLCMAALLHPDCAALRKAAGAPLLPLLTAGGHLDAQIVPTPPEPQSAAAASAFVRTAQPDEALAEALRQGFSRTLVDAPLCTLPAKLSVSDIVHGARQTVLARPAFLYKEGLTAAERGTALHAFLQFADLRAARDGLEAELERLVREQYLDAALAKKLEQSRLQAFLSSALAARMCAAQKLLREYAFITAVPAERVADVPGVIARRPVLVQGVADAVIVQPDAAEIVDYKTDRGKTPEQLLEAYAEQLLLYKTALEKRLPVPVTKCTVYSFALGRELDVPLSGKQRSGL